MRMTKVKARDLRIGDTIVTPTGNGTVGFRETHTHTIPARTVDRTIIDVNMSVGIDGNEGKLVPNMQVFADDYITVMRPESKWSRFWKAVLPSRKAKPASTEVVPLTVEVK